MNLKAKKFSSDKISEAIAPKNSINTFSKHNITIEDNHLWMLDVDAAAIKERLNNLSDKNLSNLELDENVNAATDFLVKESEYGKSYFDMHKDEITSLKNELESRIQLDDETLPKQFDDKEYAYYSVTKKELDYPIHRRKNLITNVDEVVLDVNELAVDKPHLSLSVFSISPDHGLLVYGVNHTGNEKFDLKVKDLKTGQIIDENVTDTVGSIVWFGNGFFYTPSNPVKWIANQVFYYDLTTKVSTHIYTEGVEKYSVHVSESDDRKLMFLISGDHSTNRIRLFKFDDINLKLSPRVEGIKSDISDSSIDIKSKIASSEKDLLSGQEVYIFEPKEHIEVELSSFKNGLFILTNEDSNNFGIKKLDLETKKITDFIVPSEDYITGIDTTERFLIVDYKSKGSSMIKVIDIAAVDSNIVNNNNNLNDLINKHSKSIKFDDDAYTANGEGVNFIKNTIWIGYSSMRTPNLIYSYDYDSNSLILLKQKEILGDFNIDDYKVERHFAGAVPISLVYKKSLFKGDGSNPLYLTAYGSYGISIDPRFSITSLPLLNRGFVYAIAHVRGGSDVNYDWYLNGKLFNKINTFKDFQACTQYLIDKKFTSKRNIAISGGSAGGLVVGNAINNHPEYYKVAIANVPFVDLIQTMLNEDLPLTQGEYGEWGNPNIEKDFKYMMQYDVIMNTKATAYPALLITTGIGDPRVLINEPLRWLAKIREQQVQKMKLDPSYTPDLTLLHFEKNSGHFGKSGRDAQLYEIAQGIFFVIDNMKQD